MSEAEDNAEYDLALVPTEQMVAELRNRFDGTVFAGCKHSSAAESEITLDVYGKTDVTYSLGAMVDQHCTDKFQAMVDEIGRLKNGGE
jgi:hypothetical protein